MCVCVCMSVYVYSIYTVFYQDCDHHKIQFDNMVHVHLFS